VNLPRIAIVAIGRNEGERLRACLTAARRREEAVVVYVDSGSTDGSRKLARSLGVHVVELDLSIPFTAARARNEGFARAAAEAPDLQYVQFLDGDCELRPDWIERALAELEQRPQAAIVCGRRRERHPDRTIYNLLCDMEWNTPVGRASACGGDALIRVSAFNQVNGYDSSVIAGEEPEMCVRLRQKGWEIYRIDAEMTLHDADMTRIGQWWKRNVRAGHAYAEGHHMHGAPPERHWAKPVRSNWVWGGVVPLIALLAARPTYGLSLLLLLAYPLQAYKIYRHSKTRFDSSAAMKQRFSSCWENSLK
jgi:GT2 family glycosyltransferase